MLVANWSVLSGAICRFYSQLSGMSLERFRGSLGDAAAGRALLFVREAINSSVAGDRP